MSELLEELKRLGLLRAPPARPAQTLVALCAQGCLDGGLSVALDVQPDEAFGALCAWTGGQAGALRVVDVRKKPPALIVRQGAQELTWKVPNLSALVQALNRHLAPDAKARAIAELGEYEDALHYWCIPRRALEPLLHLEAFHPLNEAFLRRAAKVLRSSTVRSS